jgi:uncharacterized sulfatase
MVQNNLWKASLALVIAGATPYGCVDAASSTTTTPAIAPLAQPRHPNILWLIGDDVGPQLGCYGYDIKTPNLDKMASQGVRYTHAYTTAPVCSPARSAFMTGMYQYSIASQDHRTLRKQPLPDGVRVLPDWLRDAGYFSANIVQMPYGAGFKGMGKNDWNFRRNIKETGKAWDSDSWNDLKDHRPF